MKWVKRIAIAIGVLLVLLVGVPFGVGSFMSRDHEARAEITVGAPAPEVWKTVADYEAMPSWWSERGKIERLPPQDGKPAFREQADGMVITYVFAKVEEPRQLVVELGDDAQYFGGSWTYDLEPAGDRRTRVTITEKGWASPAFFRFMLAVFGADSTLESCLAALRKKHGA